MRRAPFFVLFAISGAAALVYEVVWARLFTLQLGHGISAASTVLAAFMGGLAIGATVGGRTGQRLHPRQALRAYAALELLIAVLALLLPYGIAALQPVLASVYADGAGGTTFAMLRLVSSLVLVALPAAAMGATFPIASRAVVRGAASAADDAGRLYAVNTVGAAVGAVLAGFVLLPMLGLAGATWAGVALNVLAASGAWTLSARIGATTDAVPAAPAVATRRRKGTPGPAEQPRHPRLRMAALALGLSGFASLALQVVWTRLLASILGPTTYAFSIIVAVFIIGIAGGAAFGARAARHTRLPLLGLATCLAVSGACALAAASGVDWALLTLAHIIAGPDASFAGVLAREVLLTTGLLLPMTLAFGAAFPFAVATASGRDDTITADLGHIYAINTVGAILGSLLAGFVLIPLLGLHGTIRLVGAIVGAAAAVLMVLARAGGGRRAVSLALAAAVVVAAALLPSWNPLLLSSGAYKYAASIRGPDLFTALTAGQLRYYREGSMATVAVRNLVGTTSLSIDGKVDASNSGDMLTQRMLAHVPLLLHPNPKRVAILGLGSGVTLGSALTHGLDEAVVLEISPEVVEASRFFDAENHRALADPRTRLVVGDGRTHLLLSDAKYDVIVSEPSNPWMAGIASLFTREFLLAAQSRLAPGGVICQWAHTYDISSPDLRSIVATFLSVFPNGTLWMVGDADVLLIGSNEPIVDRLAGIATAWQRPGVAADLASVGARDPIAVLAMFVASGETMAGWSGDAPIQTDNRGRLEFSGPRNIFGVSTDDNALSLRQLTGVRPLPAPVTTALAAATAATWRDVGDMLHQADAFRAAYDNYVRALERDPSDAAALDGLVRSAPPINRIPMTRDILTRLAARPANLHAKLALSRLLASTGAFDDSVRLPLAVLQASPGNVPALQQLASVLADAGDAERLAPVVARLRVDAPQSADTHYYSAALAYLQQRPEVAVAEAEAALAEDPSLAKAHNLMGAALASMGQHEPARTAFTAAIGADPQDAATYSNLATLEFEAGNAVRARELFAAALTVDPQNAVARDGLTKVLAARPR